ncbi:MAG: DUF6055 domain-containing protein [Clostridium sp.]|nr:DUF6055 domain-containing protein [Clostridium sp.]
MKRMACALLAMATILPQVKAQEKYNTLWFRYDDRSKENVEIDLSGYDSLEFRKNYMVMYKTTDDGVKGDMKVYGKDGVYQFENPGRIVYKASNWAGNDYTDDNSRWSFARSMESEHYIVFWEKGFGADPTKAGSYAFNPTKLLENGERYFKLYAEELGFLKEGESTTDKYKIQMYVYYQTDWVANGSGYDFKTGAFNVSPGAVSSRDGQTVAHEIGHTFQYLVKCDLGEPHGFDYGFGPDCSGGNGWWEGCANWQAYKAYPHLKFEQDFYAAYKGQYHLNLMHETLRYQNMFVQDWWCMKHGQDFIGRMWREAERPEDPVEAYMRMTGVDVKTFGDEMYECSARLATWDLDGLREYGKSHIGDFAARMHEAADAEGWWEVDADYCPENYGYNMIPLKVPAAGTEVKAVFKGVAGADGYRRVNVDKAGWRYGFVAYTRGETRVYGDMQSDREGEASIVVPDDCTHLWFVVMGAPTEYWRHAWDDNTDNDEQWPYRVKFDQSSPSGMFRTYGVYPEDYERRDTVVVLHANLKRSADSYSSVRVQYDMDAVSEALGLSTQQMKSVRVGTDNSIRFAGISSGGGMTDNTTTSTSSATCFGHWFTATGNVCGYDGNARIFAEFYPDKYGCYVGQYPGRLVSGQEYVVRQAIVYRHTDGKEYKAVMEVHLHCI